MTVWKSFRITEEKKKLLKQCVRRGKYPDESAALRAAIDCLAEKHGCEVPA